MVKLYNTIPYCACMSDALLETNLSFMYTSKNQSNITLRVRLGTIERGCRLLLCQRATSYKLNWRLRSTLHITYKISAVDAEPTTTCSNCTCVVCGRRVQLVFPNLIRAAMLLFQNTWLLSHRPRYSCEVTRPVQPCLRAHALKFKKPNVFWHLLMGRSRRKSSCICKDAINLCEERVQTPEHILFRFFCHLLTTAELTGVDIIHSCRFQLFCACLQLP